jgi:hypothetical protein
MPFTAEQKKTFTALYDTAVNSKHEEAMLVKLKDDMIAVLTSAGEARVKHVHCKAMVPHPKNRGGSKMQMMEI